jgi:hypothetical protein
MIRSLLRAPPLATPSRTFPHVYLPLQLTFSVRRRHSHIGLVVSDRDESRRGRDGGKRLSIVERDQPHHRLLTGEKIDFRDPQQCIFELRDDRWKSLLGYALLDVNVSISGRVSGNAERDAANSSEWWRRLVLFDFVAPDVLRPHAIGDDAMWALRVRRALLRHQQRQQALSPIAVGNCARIASGSEDGLPHVVVDQIGASSIAVSCDSFAVARAFLPAIVRAIEEQARPVELIVSLQPHATESAARVGVSNDADADALAPTVQSELVSELPVGSAQLPRLVAVTENGVTLQRVAGSPVVPFNARFRATRRFLREFCIAASPAPPPPDSAVVQATDSWHVPARKMVALVGCDAATVAACVQPQESGAGAMPSALVFCKNAQTVRDMQRLLSSTCQNNGTSSNVFPSTPSELPLGLWWQQQQQQAHQRLHLVVIDASRSTAKSASKDIAALLPMTARDCLFVLMLGDTKNEDEDPLGGIDLRHLIIIKTLDNDGSVICTKR